MENEFEFTDRYKATGRPYPNPETMCQGDCEGMGFYPHKVENIALADEQLTAMSPRELIEYGQRIAMEHARASSDGYHFIKCLDCGGTGLRPN